MGTFNFVNPFNVASRVFQGGDSKVEYYARPTSSFGYYRGSPVYGGDGGTPAQGPMQQGIGVFPLGSGGTYATPSNWSPTMTVLMVLIHVEIAVFALLSFAL